MRLLQQSCTQSSGSVVRGGKGGKKASEGCEEEGFLEKWKIFYNVIKEGLKISFL